MNHRGTACATLVTTLLALIGILTAAAASASPFLHDQTPVSAIALPAGQAAGPHKLTLADVSRPRPSSYDRRATGVCLADGVNVTGGTAHFLRPQTGGRSHAYDLVGNHASAPLSQPSPAVASDGRELIGGRSVDEEASFAVALVVAAEEEGTAADEVAASTGRTEASYLTEQLAMESAQADPAAGRVLPITMTDARWQASEGWVKMAQNISGVEIHYVYNTVTGASADFKFVP
jgi:hypothetical protein